MFVDVALQTLARAVRFLRVLLDFFSAPSKLAVRRSCLLDSLLGWPEEASLEDHTIALSGLLDLLGFRSDGPCPEWLRLGWEPSELSVSCAEFVALLEEDRLVDTSKVLEQVDSFFRKFHRFP